MSTLNDKLNLIKDARDDIQTALAGKGQVVGKDIRDYAEAVANIEGGSGDVKLFDTVEHMQQDETAQEGDLAVVYREEIQPVTSESEFDSCIFPNEVVLSEAFSDSIYGSFRSTGSGWFDGMVDISSSSFRFDGWGESSNIRVQYTSLDGITYTRTDGGEELQEFGTTIIYESWGDPFPEVIGNFMKVNNNTFEGIYSYKLNNAEKDYISFTNLANVTWEYSSDSGNITVDNFTVDQYHNKLGKYDRKKLSRIISQIFIDEGQAVTSLGVNISLLKNSSNQLIVVKCSSSKWLSDICYNSDNTYLGLGRWFGNNVSNFSATTYIIDYENETYTLGQTYTCTTPFQHNGEYISYFPEIIPITAVVYLQYNNSGDRALEDRVTDFSQANGFTYRWKDTAISNGFSVDDYYYFDGYVYANTQLTLNNASQLLTNIKAYGNKGVITGDGSIWDNIPYQNILTNILKMPSSTYTGSCGIKGSITDNTGINYFENVELNKSNGATNEDLFYTYDRTPTGGIIIGVDDTYIYSKVDAHQTDLTFRMINKSTSEYVDTEIQLPVTTLGGKWFVVDGCLYYVCYGEMSTYNFYCIEYNISTKVVRLLDTFTTTGFSEGQAYYCFKKDNVLYYGMKYAGTNGRRLIGRMYANNTVSPVINDVSIIATNTENTVVDKYLLYSGGTLSNDWRIHDLTTGNITNKAHSTIGDNTISNRVTNDNKLSSTEYIIATEYATGSFTVYILNVNTLNVTKKTFTFSYGNNYLNWTFVAGSNMICMCGNSEMYFGNLDTLDVFSTSAVLNNSSSGIYIENFIIGDKGYSFNLYSSSSASENKVYKVRQLNQEFNMKNCDLMLYIRDWSNCYPIINRLSGDIIE